MEVKQIVKQFRNTIITYDIPYDEIVIASYSNGRISEITMFDGINVVDYITCNEQSAELMAKQVAKELNVKFKEV